MEKILAGAVYFHPQLKKLDIRNFYYVIPVKDEILDVRNNIFSHLNGSQIEELDISMNGVIFITPGISQYLPNLKTLMSTNNRWAFPENMYFSVHWQIHGYTHLWSVSNLVANHRMNIAVLGSRDL